MKNLLCYGIKVEVRDWARAFGIKFGDATAKKCPFCSFGNPNGNSFCGNCGAELKMVPSSMSTTDVIELAIMKAGPPPRSIQIIAGESTVYVCQVLSEGGECAFFNKPIHHYPWDAIAREIGAYVPVSEVSEQHPTMFSLSLKEK